MTRTWKKRKINCLLISLPPSLSLMASCKNLLRHLSNTLARFCLSWTAFFALASIVIFFVVASLVREPFAKCSSFNAGVLSESSSSAAFLSSSHIRKSLSESHLAVKKTEDVLLLESGDRSNGSFEDLAACDLFDGKWVVDRESPKYAPGTCPFVDNALDCFKNERPDSGYMSLRWVPKGCAMPRLRGRRMLEMLRGKRLAFVGDSLNRNMWESLVCILRDSLHDKDRVHEISGKHHLRTGGFHAFRFIDFNCTLEFFRSPFLVQPWEADVNGTRKETLRLDLIDEASDKYKEADVIIFNTGHWWTHEKTSRGRDYYQEGDSVHSKLSASEAYHQALLTWARWVDANIDPDRTTVFFRGYSASHFRGGRWNSGGSCKGERFPITDDSHLRRHPKMMSILESVIEKTSTPVVYLNITRMTDYRKDGHPSVYRKPAVQRRPGDYQDCSHWCLPGVPDAWNELLYAVLLRGQHARTRSNQLAQTS